MTLRTAVIAMVLAVAPTLSFAGGGCGWGHETQQVMSCGEGQIYDADTQSCVDQVSS